MYIVIIALSITIPICSLVSFVIGFKVARSIITTNDIQVPKINAQKPQKIVITDEERQAKLIYDNIENYGTKIPQKDVI